MLDVHPGPTNANMSIDEEVSTRKADANPVFAPRPVGRPRGLPGRHLLRSLRLPLGQPLYAEAPRRSPSTRAEVGHVSFVLRGPRGSPLLAGVPSRGSRQPSSGDH